MRLLYVVGNRPQFIKLALLQAEADKYRNIHPHIVHTGQHYSANMSDVFFDQLCINTAITKLGIRNNTHAGMIGEMMLALEPVMRSQQPDFVIVFGDTNTTLAGALTAKKLNLPLVHIEAGIRTGDEQMPEESNRYLTDRMADINFCCTHENVKNLEDEGFGKKLSQRQVIMCGDLMYDAYMQYNKNPRDDAAIKAQLPETDFIFFTLHRKQNVENPVQLRSIMQGMTAIHQQMPVVFAIHPNTRKLLGKYNISCSMDTLQPQGYLETQQILRRCSYVITDSGGVQREAYFHQKPALILMEQPFWPELIKYGCALASASDADSITGNFTKLTKKENIFTPGVFGDGTAARQIIRYLLHEQEKN